MSASPESTVAATPAIKTNYIVRNEKTGRAVQFNGSKSGFEFVDDLQATLFDSSHQAFVRASGSTLHRWGAYTIVPFEYQQSLF